MKTNLITLFSALTIAVAFSSCKRDEPAPSTPTAIRTFAPGEGIFVLNEGGFTAGNSSISYYATAGADAGNTFNDLFRKANNVPLGDVAQTEVLINNQLYVVVNNSGKVVVMNPHTLFITKTITGLAGPRNILAVNSSVALITQMYSDQIAILDLSTNTISGYINLGVTSEALVMTAGKIFVSSLESDKLYALSDANPNTVIDSSVTIVRGGNSMVTDNNGKIWILSYGSYFPSLAGGLFRVNPSALQVEASMPLTTSDFATHLCTNPAGDSLFFLNFSIYRMSVNDVVLPSTGFISGVGHSFYTIGLCPNTSNFFAGDAVDYVQSGLIFRYNGAGSQTDVDTVGVIPNSFLMY